MKSRYGRSLFSVLLGSALAVSAFASPASAHDSKSESHGGRGHFIDSDSHHEPSGWFFHGRKHHGSSDPVVVTSGLNNPRQLSLVDNGVLLIAEAGNGGRACQGEGEDAMCVGASGSIGAVLLPQAGENRDHLELVKNLISGAGPDGSFAVGSDGVSQHDLRSKILIQETWAPPDAFPAGVPGEQAGQLLTARPFGTAEPFADITKFETDHDPDGQGFDSDPYAVVARKHDALVADAAGNDILRVDEHGNVSLFHVFPDVVSAAAPDGADFVPTSLALGPHGDVYVGGLVGEVPGQGQVVKLDGRTGEVEKTWSGFTTVTGVAVGHDGTLYVSQLFAPQANPVNPEIAGVLTKVSRDGTRHDVDVPFPAGVAVDKWGTVFVSAFSIAPAAGLPGTPPGVDTSGQVWRLRF
jgi:hypothetical protein